VPNFKLLSLIIIILTFAVTASAEVKGWGLGIGLDDGDFGVQGRKDIWLGGDISQITTQVSVYFHHLTTFKADVDYHFISYPGAKHAFTNPDADSYGKQFGLPLEYNATADRESWQTMQEFFAKIFE